MLIPSYQTTVVTDDGVSITTNADGSISKYYPDGKRVYEYPPPDERRKVTEVPQDWGPPERTVEFRNGTTKITKSGLDPTIWIYPNGTKIKVDRLWFTEGMPHVKKINHSNGTEVYFKNGVEEYRVTTTKLPDGTEIKVYGDKTRSTKYPTGVTITEYPNGNTVISFPDGTYQINYKDGTVEKRSKDHKTIERIEPTQETPSQEDLRSYVPQNPLIPDWFKSNAKWWKEGLISDAEIVSALENLIEQDIIPLERFTDQSSGLEHMAGVPKGGTFIPTYIKDVFGFWGDDLVSDNEVANSVGFLIGQGLISSEKIQQKRNEIIEASFSIYSDDEIMDMFKVTKSSLSSEQLQHLIAFIDSKIKEQHIGEIPSTTSITELDRAKMAFQLFGFEKTSGYFTVPGLDIEEEPIEYRTGSEDTFLTKQPGLKKYANISMKIPRPDAKEIIFDFYEISKWNKLGALLLEKSSELESEYVKTQLDDAWNDYSDTNDMQIQKKAIALESDYKKINSKLNDLDSLIDDIDAFEGIIISESGKLGIPILELESAGKEPQSKIESDVKRGSSDFEKVHSQAEEAIRTGDKKTRILDDLLWDGYSSGRYVTPTLDKQTSDDSSFSSYYQLSDHLPVKADFIQKRLHELQTPVVPEPESEPTVEPVEENQETSVSSPEASSQTEYQITVVEMDGKQFPITQFTIWKWEGECDSMWHYHTASSHATSLQSTIKNDPDPDNCGFGLVDYIPKTTTTITEDQMNQFKEMTGINPVGSEPIYGGEGP